MIIPDVVAREINAATGTRIVDAQSVGGGCISNTARLTLEDKREVFLKWGSEPDIERDMFVAEVAGLEALSAAGALRVPQVLQISDAGVDRYCWLLLEWLEPGRLNAEGWGALGRGLAAVHGSRNDRFGWPHANFIGSLPQSNRWQDDWPRFWCEQRILPQLQQAVDAGRLSASQGRGIEIVLERAAEILQIGNDEGASLLHGDLWVGNVHGLANGAGALIDPSCYYGHREVDLAMAALFGGFDQRFFLTYEEAWPLQPGYEERRALYQLYYVLVHVNLFGGSYVQSALSIAAQLGA